MDGTLNSLCTDFWRPFKFACVRINQRQIESYAYARQKRCLWHPNMENFLQKTQPFVMHFNQQQVKLSVYWKLSKTLLCKKRSNLFIGPNRSKCWLQDASFFSSFCNFELNAFVNTRRVYAFVNLSFFSSFLFSFFLFFFFQIENVIPNYSKEIWVCLSVFYWV